MSKTSLAVGNLRAVAILLVLAFHSLTAYLGSQPASPHPFDTPPYRWMANPIIDTARWFGFDLFCASQFLYLMQLMFFLSGLFIWPSLARKGGLAFVLDRWLRLGVPFLLGTYMLMPIAFYATYRVSAVDPSWPAFWEHWLALPFWPSGPMWFLWFLFALNVAVAGPLCIAPRAGQALRWLGAVAGQRPRRFLIGLIVASAVAYVPLSLVTTPWEYSDFGPLALQLGIAPQYVIYFLAGIAVGAAGLERGLLAPDGFLAHSWRFGVAGALGSFVLWLVPTALMVEGATVAIPVLRLAAALGYVLYTASMCFGLAAVFLRFAAAPRPILGSVSEFAFGIYLFHYVFVIWSQYLLLDFALPAVVKGLVAFTATAGLSWAATAAMCRIPLGARLILGRALPIPARSG
jgi:hypothetical protein